MMFKSRQRLTDHRIDTIREVKKRAEVVAEQRSAVVDRIASRGHRGWLSMTT